jgi:hypothetical protein
MRRFALWILLVACPASGARAETNPFSFDAAYTSRGLGLRLDYRVRWDSSDLRRTPKTIGKALLRPDLALARNARLLAAGTNLRFFGLRVRPARMWGAPVEDPAVNGENRTARRRGLSLAPVLADLRRDLNREIRRGLIREGFEYLIPQARNVSFAQKEAMVDSLFQAQRQWRDPLY